MTEIGSSEKPMDTESSSIKAVLFTRALGSLISSTDKGMKCGQMEAAMKAITTRV
jgi:hypothetical protein